LLQSRAIRSPFGKDLFCFLSLRKGLLLSWFEGLIYKFLSGYLEFFMLLFDLFLFCVLSLLVSCENRCIIHWFFKRVWMDIIEK
jgi:hypothetical protein